MKTLWQKLSPVQQYTLRLLGFFNSLLHAILSSVTGVILLIENTNRIIPPEMILGMFAITAISLLFCKHLYETAA